MNVLISVCENFLFPAKVMLYSLSLHHEELHIYIIYQSLTKKHLDDLEMFVNTVCHATLTAIKAGEDFLYAPLSEQFGKPELYFRLLAPYILPKEMERILYLDADIIVQSSLTKFYEQSFDGKLAVFVKARFDENDQVVCQKKKLGMTPEDVYFNSGAILFNLKAFRETISFEEILTFIREKREMLYYFDQDLLNAMLVDKKKISDDRFNFQVEPMESLTITDVESAAVLHYTDLPKPWTPEYYGTLDYIFWRHALKAGFVEEYLDYWENRCRLEEHKKMMEQQSE